MIDPLVHWSRAQPARPQVIHLPDKARGMGIYLLAGKGSGKSRFMGRVIATQDCLRGTPQVIWDAAGGLIDNFLDKVRRLPSERQAALWPRIRYVEMSGKFGHVVPWPLYQRLPGDTLFETAQRYLEVVKRIDPNLTTASIEGWNALWETGTHTGMVLAALGGQITEADELLNHTTVWEPALLAARERHPELAKAVSFLLALADDKTRDRRLKSFLIKIAPFSLDPTMKAMFGAAEPGIDWEEVVARGETVLLDFRHELDSERRRLKMLWVFQSFLTFIKRRGVGRGKPVGLVIDELTTLINFDAQGASQIFSADLDNLINVIARYFGVNLTLCHQELFQIDVQTRKTLMGMGTKIIGVTQDMEAALTLAQELLPYDPTRIKRFEPVFAGMQGQLVDLQPVEWTIQEQRELAAQLFTRLRPFHFLVKPAVGEGDVTGRLYPLTIKNIDRGIWVDEDAVREIRKTLLVRSGQPLEEVLAAIEARRQALLSRRSVLAAGSEPDDPLETSGPVRADLPVRKEEFVYEEDDDDDVLSTFRETIG